MNISNASDRIWHNLRNMERLSRYYSRRSRQLEIRQKIISFVVVVPLLIAVGLFQTGWENAAEITSALLFVTGICEAAIIHFGLGGDIKAAKIASNQTGELAQQWRKLWIDQHRADIVQWIDVLESLTVRATSEIISHPTVNLKRKNYLDIECAKEAKHALQRQFGKQEANTTHT